MFRIGESMNRKEKKEQVMQIKRGVSFIKSDLIRTANQLREVSAREADKLDRIIFRLEQWQNR
jgi:hypothetical protein